MPTFEIVSINDAVRSAGGSRRQQALQEYVSFIEQLPGGQAGKLTPSTGETSLTVRRRISSAAKLVGRELDIKRVGEEVFFWVKTAGSSRRRGRPRKTV